MKTSHSASCMELPEVFSVFCDDIRDNSLATFPHNPFPVLCSRETRLLCSRETPFCGPKDISLEEI